MVMLYLTECLKLCLERMWPLVVSLDAPLNWRKSLGKKEVSIPHFRNKVPFSE